MNPRLNTKPIRVGNLVIGGQNRVVIQSMCNIKTSHIDEVIAQIISLEQLGVEMIRVSVMDDEDAHAIADIKKAIHIPLVADIHFSARLAILACESGADKIRINPGNIGDEAALAEVVQCCKRLHIPIRIGVNSGSIDATIAASGQRIGAAELVASCLKHVRLIEAMGFNQIILSLKGSDVLETIEAYRLAAKTFPYPLHLGITEAGTKEIGIIRSAAGLAPLLLEGIGDTLRISLSGDPRHEVIAAKRLLHDLGLYPNYPTLISCPTCGRTQVDVEAVAEAVAERLETINKPIRVAVMGCIVNGPGEASQADIGIAGGHDCWLLFRHGKIIRKVPSTDVLDALFAEIHAFLS